MLRYFRLKQLLQPECSALKPWSHLVSALLIVAILTTSTGIAFPQASQSDKDKLPRFGSLKSNPANLRKGPGRQYPKSWVFRRAGLPIEIIQVYGTWRRIRDSEGASGWVSQYLLSRRRTALVLPWEVKKSTHPIYVDLQSSIQTTAKTIARLQAGSLVNIKSCDGQWCHVTINNFAGYLSQKVLWGVYPSEKIS